MSLFFFNPFMAERDDFGELRRPLESQDERFVISPDPISQDRFEFVQQIGQELMVLPFYRGLTLKGSLAKGKNLNEYNAPAADLNMGCFLDFNEIDKYSIEFLRGLCRKDEVNDKEDEGPIKVNDGKWNIFTSQNLSPEVLAKLRVARRVVNEFVRGHAAQFFRDPRYQPKGIYPETAIYSETGALSIYSALTQYEALPPYNPSDKESAKTREAVTRAACAPFSLIINGDLTSYMKGFFNELDRLDGETAEQKWQSVRRAIVQNERWGSPSPKVDLQIPKNVEEAKDLYLAKGGPHLH